MPVERGDYRPIYTVIIDGPDFRALPRDAKLLWYTLKLALPAWGIGPIPGFGETMRERIGFDQMELDRAWDAIEMGSWASRNGVLYYLHRGLMFEPGLQASNPNHRKALVRFLASLPSSPIVRKFKQDYAMWFPGDPDAVPTAPTHADTIPAPSAGDRQPIAITDTDTETETETEPEKEEGGAPVTGSYAELLVRIGEHPAKRTVQSLMNGLITRRLNQEAWALACCNFLDGLGTPSLKNCSIDQLGVGVGQFLQLKAETSDWPPRLLAACVGDAMRDRTPKAGKRGSDAQFDRNVATLRAVKLESA